MPDTESPKYGSGWSLSEFEQGESERLIREFLDFFSTQKVHRYAVGHILRDIARKVEEREL